MLDSLTACTGSIFIISFYLSCLSFVDTADNPRPQ
jgi:hypothetical protein